MEGYAMRADDFRKLRQDSLDRRDALSKKKRADYASESDMLINFKRIGGAARCLRIPEIMALLPPLGYSSLMEVMKLDRRLNVVLHYLETGERPANEGIIDTFDDHKNYLDISEAIVIELCGLATPPSGPVHRRNANYLKGRAKEYRKMKEGREKGYEVMRSAGSHGKFDVMWIRAPTQKLQGAIVLWQCKTGKSAKRARAKVLPELALFGGTYSVEVRVD